MLGEMEREPEPSISTPKQWPLSKSQGSEGNSFGYFGGPATSGRGAGRPLLLLIGCLEVDEPAQLLFDLPTACSQNSQQVGAHFSLVRQQINIFRRLHSKAGCCLADEADLPLLLKMQRFHTRLLLTCLRVARGPPLLQQLRQASSVGILRHRSLPAFGGLDVMGRGFTRSETSEQQMCSAGGKKPSLQRICKHLRRTPKLHSSWTMQAAARPP